MELSPKKGIGQLLFGMKQIHVETLLGKPDKQFSDDDNNKIYVYNQAKLRITFYEDEGFRFGYIISANPDLTLFGNKVIGKTAQDAKSELPKSFKTWETEAFDLTDNHFNEPNWLILQEEFGIISKVEMGAVFNDKDEVEWAFQS